MAEEWLDQRALKALGVADDNHKVITVSDIDDDIDIPVPEKTIFYDPDKLNVVLPGTTEVHRIEYVPPKINLESTNTGTNSVPDFITPDPRFDVFEHFQYEWVAIPELERPPSVFK